MTTPAATPDVSCGFVFVVVEQWTSVMLHLKFRKTATGINKVSELFVEMVLYLMHLPWNFFFLWRCDPTQVTAFSFLMFLDHTRCRTTVGRTPLDEWSARRRDLYLTTHNTHNRQTSMPSVGFKPTISAGEWPQTYALDSHWERHFSWNGLENLEVHEDLEDDTRQRQPSTAENSQTFLKVHKLGGPEIVECP